MKNSRVLACVSGLLLITFVAGAADLSGRVTFRAAPLPGAVVTANFIGPQQGPASVSVTKTDSGGQYLLKGLRTGDYIVFVDMNGKRVYQGRLSLTAPALVKNIDFK